MLHLTAPRSTPSWRAPTKSCASSSTGTHSSCSFCLRLVRCLLCLLNTALWFRAALHHGLWESEIQATRFLVCRELDKVDPIA